MTSGSGDTALEMASYFGHVEVAKLLLEAGADATISDKYGHTPLSLARLSKHQTCVGLLEVRGNH